MTPDILFLQPYLVERLSEIDGLSVKTATSVVDMNKAFAGDGPYALVRCLGMERVSEGNSDALLLEQTWVVGLIRRGVLTEKSTGDGELVMQIVSKLHGWTPDVYETAPLQFERTEPEFGPTREYVSLFTTTVEINLR